MKVDKFHKQSKKLAPWATLCVLCLVSAMIFVAPSVVFAAQFSAVLSLDCEKALVNTEQTITATVTDNNNGGVAADVKVAFAIQSGANAGSPAYITRTDAEGIAKFTYTDVGDATERMDTIVFVAYPPTDETMADFFMFTNVYWTPDHQDPVVISCMEPSSQTVEVGGRGKLNVKKRGSMRIMVCSDGELDLYSVDPESVTLAGVKPERWKYKDRKYCPGGKDGFVDLVFKFKNKKIVQALEGVLAEELEDADEVDLHLAGSLDDGTPLEGTYTVEIVKKSKKTKKCKKKKMAKKDR